MSSDNVKMAIMQKLSTDASMQCTDTLLGVVVSKKCLVHLLVTDRMIPLGVRWPLAPIRRAGLLPACAVAMAFH